MNIDSILILVLISLALLLILKRKARTFLAPKFERRPIMNRPEKFLFDSLRREFPSHWHIMSQVSYGSFLKNSSRNKYLSINSKRADFVVLYPSLDVAAVFEYHGTGHFGSTKQSKQRAIASDSIKWNACEEAGIPLVQLPSYIDVDELRNLIRNIVAPKPVAETKTY